MRMLGVPSTFQKVISKIQIIYLDASDGYVIYRYMRSASHRNNSG